MKNNLLKLTTNCTLRTWNKITKPLIMSKLQDRMDLILLSFFWTRDTPFMGLSEEAPPSTPGGSHTSMMTQGPTEKER